MGSGELKVSRREPKGRQVDLAVWSLGFDVVARLIDPRESQPQTRIRFVLSGVAGD